MTDEEIAVRIMALDEGDAVDEWVKKWEPMFHSWSQDEHSGDCTKQPWTCSRCVYEETMARVPDYRRLFSIAP